MQKFYPYFFIWIFCSPLLVKAEKIADSTESIQSERMEVTAIRELHNRNILSMDSAEAMKELEEFKKFTAKKQCLGCADICRFYVGFYLFWKVPGKRQEGIDHMTRVAEEVSRKKDNFAYPFLLNYLGRALLLEDPVKGFEYLLRADRAMEKTGYDKWGSTAALLLSNVGHAYDYFENTAKALYYLKKSAEYLPEEPSIMKATTYGYIANSYENIREYDEALEYFQKGRRLATELGDSAIMGALSGNIGYMYLKQSRYDLARPMIEEDLQMSRRYNNIMSLTGAHFMMAELDLKEGFVDAAEQHVDNGYALLINSVFRPFDRFWRIYYQLRSDIALARGEKDEAILYMDSLTHLKDSVSAAKDVNLISGVETLLLTEKHLNDIEIYEKEMSRARLIRNTSWIILALFILFLGGVISSLRSRQKRLRQRQQYELLLERQKSREEIAQYRNQLEAQINGIRQKSQLVEKFQQHTEGEEGVEDDSQVAMLNKLYEAVILTEDDWKEFRRLFEATHPGFISKLRAEYPDLTISEIRFLVLMKLNFTLSEISNTLGIFPASVRQTRNRLRRKLRLESHKDIVKLVADL